MRRMIIWKTLSSVRTSVTSSIARPSPGAPWTPSCEYTHNLHVSRPGTARIASSGRTIMAHYMTDYAATRRDFRLAVPARFNWAFDTFDAWARDPGKLALLWVSPDGQPRRFTFAELGARSRRFANVLAGLGVGRGERVLVVLPRVPAWWEILLGCLRGLAVSVPGTTLLTPKDIRYRLGVSEASVVVTDEDDTWKVDQGLAGGGWLEYAALMARASERVAHPKNPSADPMMIYFTSGTTGQR